MAGCYAAPPQTQTVCSVGVQEAVFELYPGPPLARRTFVLRVEDDCCVPYNCLKFRAAEDTYTILNI